MVAGKYGTMGESVAPGSKDPATDRDDRRDMGDAPTFDRTADVGTVYVSTATARTSVGPRHG